MIGKNDLRCQTQIKMSQGESRRQGVHSISRPSGMGISREVLVEAKKNIGVVTLARRYISMCLPRSIPTPEAGPEKPSGFVMPTTKPGDFPYFVR